MKVQIKQFEDIFIKILDALDELRPTEGALLKKELKNKFNINYVINYGSASCLDDVFVFKSEEDYFLFLMQWS